MLLNGIVTKCELTRHERHGSHRKVFMGNFSDGNIWKHYSLVLFSMLENALIKAVIRCSIAAANILEAPEPGSNEQTTTFAPLFRFIFSSA